MANVFDRLMNASALKDIGLVLALGQNSAVVGDVISGWLPEGTAGFGLLVFVVGAVMNLWALGSK